MADLDTAEDRTLERNRRTLFLLVGGTVSLLIPAVGAMVYYAFIRPPDGSSSKSGGSLFEKRVAERKLLPAATSAAPMTARISGEGAAVSPAPIQEAVPVAPTGSLGFLRGGEDYSEPGQAPPPASGAMADAQAMGGTMQAPPQAVSGPPAPAPAKAAPPAAPRARTAAAPAPKPFNAPKLRPTQGFTSLSQFGGGGTGGGSGGGGAMAAPGLGGQGGQGGRAGASGLPGAAGQGQAGGGLPQGGMPQMPAGLPPLPPGAKPPPGMKMPEMPQIQAGPGGQPDAQALIQGAGKMVGGVGDMVGGALDKIPKGTLPGGTPDVKGMLNNIPGVGGDQKK